MCKKPILIWDDGKAVCTLTHSSDFAVGFVGLIGNEKSYNEAFHITSDERLTWSDVLEQTGNALGIKPEVFSAKTEEIVRLLPEYNGVLLGDKAHNQLFDNTKIKNAVHEFRILSHSARV